MEQGVFDNHKRLVVDPLVEASNRLQRFQMALAEEGKIGSMNYICTVEARRGIEKALKAVQATQTQEEYEAAQAKAALEGEAGC